MPKKWKVNLRSERRKKLLCIDRTGRRNAREILSAHILLKVAQDWTYEVIAEAFDTSIKTVQRTRQQFAQAGVNAALTKRERLEQPPKLTAEQEILVVALACSPPPTGFRRWTVRLLTSEAITRHIVPEIVLETARQVLKKRTQTMAGRKLGAGPRSPRRSWPA